MDAHDLTVEVAHDGRVCVLTVGGELDATVADEFLARTAQAVTGTAQYGAGRAERLVLDLSGLMFLDCTGAGALASVTCAVPAQCPVIVRSLSPAARRVFGLMGLNLEHRPLASAPGHPEDSMGQLLLRSRAVRSAAREVMGQIRGVAEAVSVTEDRIAATMTRIAGQRPHRAARLTVLSEQARGYAEANRRLIAQSSLQSGERQAG